MENISEYSSLQPEHASLSDIQIESAGDTVFVTLPENKGGMVLEKHDDTLKISNISVQESGKGYGTLLYEKVLQYCINNNLNFESDYGVSPEVITIYQKMEEKGYKFKKAKLVKKELGKGLRFLSEDYGPAFKLIRPE
jgi:hypothetical protein